MGEIIRFGNFKIESKDYLYGVSTWINYYNDRIPRFDIWIYMGLDTTENLHFFRKRNSPEVISKTLKELSIAPSFRPFVFDTKRLKAVFDSEEKR